MLPAAETAQFGEPAPSPDAAPSALAVPLPHSADRGSAGVSRDINRRGRVHALPPGTFEGGMATVSRGLAGRAGARPTGGIPAGGDAA